MHVVWRLRLTDAEDTDEVRNAAGKGKACGILGIKALRRGLRLAPQLRIACCGRNFGGRCVEEP